MYLDFINTVVTKNLNFIYVQDNWYMIDLLLSNFLFVF